MKDKLRKIITESLRVQRHGPKQVGYVDSANDLADACAKQNHVIFGRRGCGKSLLLQESSKQIEKEHGGLIVPINCEDYKNHSFPNVLVEILDVIFDKLGMGIGLFTFFGKKKKTKKIILNIKYQLKLLREKADERSENIKEKTETSQQDSVNVGVVSEVANIGMGVNDAIKKETERTYKRFDSKIDNLNHLLPQLKRDLDKFFRLAPKVKFVFIQLDDFYHLNKGVQPYVIDYIHRLCKDLPLYFKVATLRFASTLFIERSGQPVGVQERQDYQPINIDFTFQDFIKTENQIKNIFYKYGELAGENAQYIDNLFKGDGFRRLVLAGGGVPRDCLSLFKTASDSISNDDGRIGKDEVRVLSLSNLDRRIQELNSDSQQEEQEALLKGIYTIRKFCIDRKNNIFLIPERLMQEHEDIKKLIYRLLDYRIIHSVGTAFTHKSQPGTYNAFMIDIGCYANLRKLDGKMNEIDLSSHEAKEKIRSVPIFSESDFKTIWDAAPKDVTKEILAKDS